MAEGFTFDVKKYLGVWYELAHYPTWFQRNDAYNTQAEYSMNDDGTVAVRNSTISNGKPFVSLGKATMTNENAFYVEFPMPEVEKLRASGQFNVQDLPLEDKSIPNYVVDMVFLNCHGDYVFAIVTDPSKDSFYLLSRYPRPSLCAYNDVMAYVATNYDSKRLVQTPHYK